MIIQQDPEALNYVNAILHPLARGKATSFEKFCEACLHADINNYELLRPALHIFMVRYPADPARLKMEEQDNQGGKTMSTSKNVLSTLAGVENGVTLAIMLGGQLVPLATGLVREIRQVATGAKTVTYKVLIETDTAELDAIDKLSTDDLTAINAELKKLGLEPVPVPTPAVPDPEKESSSGS